MQKISHRSMALIWFSAAVSAGQILIGTWFAPLGWQEGLVTILTGHFIGGALLFAAGLIGAKTQKNAMQTVQLSYGLRGSSLFALFNALQFIGWLAISVYVGAEVVSALLATSSDYFAWIALGLGGLVLVWIALGLTNNNWLQNASLITMFLLMLWLSFNIFSGNYATTPADDSMSFGAGVELAAAAPLSWIAIISDYTKDGKTPVKSTLVAVTTYVISSSWMLALGLAAAILTGQFDVSPILMLAGVSVVEMLIVLISTSAISAICGFASGMSLNNVSERFTVTPTAIIVVIIGATLAATLPVREAQDFLYIIASIFAPMIAVLIADFFLLKRTQSTQSFDFVGLSLWLVSFLVYRYLINIGWETPLGLTVPMVFGTILLTIIVRKLLQK